MVRFLVGVGALVVAVPTHVGAALWTFFGACSISDTAEVVPAPASIQGRLCDAQDHWMNVVPYVLLAASIVLAAVLAILLWDSAWRWVGLTSAVWLALVTGMLLALPPEGCLPSQEARARHGECSRVGNA
jgi:hypothetical protein